MEAQATRLAGGGARLAQLGALLPHIAVGVVAATVAASFALHSAGTRLGAGLAPFNARWEPDVAPYAIAAAAVLAFAVLAGPRLLSWPRSPVGFAAVTFGLGLLARLALGAARDGPGRWSAVFGSDPAAQNEYLPALAALEPGLGTFLDRFAEVALTLPIHPSAHPPGVLVSLHWLGIDGPGGAAALAILGGALVVPLAYALARQLMHERRARVATLFVLLAPSSLLFGATSFDSLFAALGTLAAALLISRGRLARAAAGPALALTSFFSFALLAIGAWAVGVAALRRGVRPALALAAWAAVAVAGSYVLLYAATGFDPIGTVQAASDAYFLGIANVRPYEYWLFGSPVAAFVAMGVPLAWYALRALGRGEPTAVALAVIVVVAALLGFTKAETERIWLFMVPLAAVSAASVVPLSRLKLVLAVLAAQALAVELTLWTIW